MQEGERVRIDINQLTDVRENNQGQSTTVGNYCGSGIMNIQSRDGYVSRYTYEPRTGKTLSEGVELGNNDYMGYLESD